MNRSTVCASATRDYAIRLDPHETSGGGEGTRHLLKHPEHVDALSTDHVLVKVGERVKNGELVEVEVHFASELSAVVNNLDANLQKLSVQLRTLLAEVPPEQQGPLSGGHRPRQRHPAQPGR